MSDRAEIIMTPYEVYLAPAGESEVSLSVADPTSSTNFVLLGTYGKKNYAEGGVTLNLPNSYTEHRNAGSTGIIKVTRNEEGISFSLELEDFTPEQFRHALNHNTPASAAGETETQLYRGLTVYEYAVIIRGVSPYQSDKLAQFYVPRCYNSGEPSITFDKGSAAALALEFTALENQAAATEEERFGHYVCEEADT